jgi:carboxyl-terminal processing protease
MNKFLQIMKKNIKLIAVIVLISLAFWGFKSFTKTEVLPMNEKDKTLIEILTYVLERGHYEPRVVNDQMSEAMFNDFIEQVDYLKRFFLQSDIDEFEKYKLELDDAIKNKDLTFFNLVYTRLMERMQDAKLFHAELLKKPFDYDNNETYSTDFKSTTYAKDKSELKDKWRKNLQWATISTISENEKIEVAKAKDDPKYKVKSFEVLEKEARKNAEKNQKEYFDYLEKEVEKSDYFSSFINAFTMQFDPHTNYMAPEAKEKFDTSISGKFEGIGARLQKENDYTKITDLITGGPAWKGKELEPGDIILRVAQGNQPAEEIVGLKLDKVVKKIKGPKGTEVRLTVKKADGSIKVISVMRDIIETEETYAKSNIIEKEGKKYGIIYLPKFYIDFEDINNRDAAKDVKIEIENLKKEGISGLIMDVRDNGGGSLKTVVDIAGYFIDKGPIVQIKANGNKKEVLTDTDNKILWDGPLVVMVNNFSASASEILAAAIQDYGRGIVIGSKQTHGKGTVQNVYDLNQIIRGSNLGDMGALKITTQKYYRIDGGSTQLEGVKPDVVMPDRYSEVEIGEKDIPNAMPWSKIDKSNYTPCNLGNLKETITKSKARVASNPIFKSIEENAKWLKQLSDDNTIQLNYKKFKGENEKLEESNKKFKKLLEYKNELTFNILPKERELMDKDEAFKLKKERWIEEMSKDIYLDEAISVLNDLNQKSTQNLTIKSKEGVIKSK